MGQEAHCDWYFWEKLRETKGLLESTRGMTVWQDFTTVWWRFRVMHICWCYLSLTCLEILIEEFTLVFPALSSLLFRFCSQHQHISHTPSILLLNLKQVSCGTWVIYGPCDGLFLNSWNIYFLLKWYYKGMLLCISLWFHLKVIFNLYTCKISARKFLVFWWH